MFQPKSVWNQFKKSMGKSYVTVLKGFLRAHLKTYLRRSMVNAHYNWNGYFCNSWQDEISVIQQKVVKSVWVSEIASSIWQVSTRIDYVTVFVVFRQLCLRDACVFLGPSTALRNHTVDLCWEMAYNTTSTLFLLYISQTSSEKQNSQRKSSWRIYSKTLDHPNSFVELWNHFNASAKTIVLKITQNKESGARCHDFPFGYGLPFSKHHKTKTSQSGLPAVKGAADYTTLSICHWNMFKSYTWSLIS